MSVTEPCSEKFITRLIGKTDMEDALQKLDHLTTEETRMAAVQVLRTTHSVDYRASGVVDTVVAVNDRVASVDNRVVDVDSRVKRVDGRVLDIRDEVMTISKDIMVAHSEQPIFFVVLPLGPHASFQEPECKRAFSNGSRRRIRQ
jgi:hypothetical protein